jgi:hypothetical protein
MIFDVALCTATDHGIQGLRFNNLNEKEYIFLGTLAAKQGFGFIVERKALPVQTMDILNAEVIDPRD